MLPEEVRRRLGSADGIENVGTEFHEDSSSLKGLTRPVECDCGPHFTPPKFSRVVGTSMFLGCLQLEIHGIFDEGDL